MMTHRSIKSSHVQVRTKPALRLCQRSFQKVVADFMKSKEIPQVLEHGLRSNGRQALTSKVFYVWRRLTHLRSAFLYIAEGTPVVMIPPFAKEDGKAWTIRVPINHRAVAAVGPIVCECYWDPMDHDLTISDVVYYNKELVWETHDYSERFQMIHTIVNDVIQNTDDFSDCVVSIPPFEKLSAAAGWEEDDAFCVAFQPEDRGSRRFRWTSASAGVSGGAGANTNPRMNSKKYTEEKRTTRAEHPMRRSPPGEPGSTNVGRRTIGIIDEDDEFDFIPAKPVAEPDDSETIDIDMLNEYTSKLPAPSAIVTELLKKNESATSTTSSATTTKKKDMQPAAAADTIVCLLELDTKNPLPDVYVLRRESGGASCGIAAVRSLAVSLEIRAALKRVGTLRVNAVWYEPFKKWEVVQIL